jgi:hypothetical protein
MARSQVVTKLLVLIALLACTANATAARSSLSSVSCVHTHQQPFSCMLLSHVLHAPRGDCEGYTCVNDLQMPCVM